MVALVLTFKLSPEGLILRLLCVSLRIILFFHFSFQPLGGLGTLTGLLEYPLSHVSRKKITPVANHFSITRRNFVDLAPVLRLIINHQVRQDHGRLNVFQTNQPASKKDQIRLRRREENESLSHLSQTQRF